MSVQGDIRSSEEDLADALASGQLSEAIAQQGQDILDRMQRPLRLSVMGLPGSGKSTLMNFLLGADVFPQGLALPTMAITHAQQPSAKCTLANGDFQVLESADFDQIALLEPAFVEVTMPLPALTKLSMMEVVAGLEHEEQKRAMRWAAKRTDIALWCSQSCGMSEQMLWALLPDHVKDHSFLVLTKADTLRAAGRLSHLESLAEDVAAESFRQILPLDTHAALSARKSDGTVDKEVLRASGGMALISAVLHEVETGRRAAEDAADIFLRQIDFDPTAYTAPSKAEASQDDPPPSVSEPPEPSQDDRPVASLEAAKDADLPKAEQVPPLTEAARTACAQVVEQLVAEGEALAHQLASDKLSPNAAIDIAVDTITWVAEYLGAAEIANEPGMTRTCATAADAADLIQLIQLEKGDDVAEDALSLMVQLKQEIQAELAV